MEQPLRFEDASRSFRASWKNWKAGRVLDEMLRLYEEGMKLVKACETQLDAYEATITKLGQSAGGGEDA
jgi:exonuclease VII small subunit